MFYWLFRYRSKIAWCGVEEDKIAQVVALDRLDELGFALTLLFYR